MDDGGEQIGEAVVLETKVSPIVCTVLRDENYLLDTLPKQFADLSHDQLWRLAAQEAFHARDCAKRAFLITAVRNLYVGARAARHAGKHLEIQQAGRRKVDQRQRRARGAFVQ